MIDEVFILSLNRWRKAIIHLAEMETELLEQGIVPFTAAIAKGNRITIPQEVMEKLKLEVNDRILIPVYKLSQTEVPPKKKRRRRRKPTVEPVEEEVSFEETPKASQIVPPRPMIREPVVKPKPKEDIKEEQEYVEPCIKGLDRPLQNLVICRKCEHYKRKWGRFPEACNWKKWRKIGWEDEIEEEPVAEEPIAEPELEEPIEEITEDEDYEVVMLHCDSGVHEPGPVPHRKKVQRRGWAMYTCTICNKETPWLISKAEKVEVKS